ncbi:MAG TPA: diguanylate cyclase [Sideroxyarcus sp.]|nr:diguanylate cyclase [Sideroxyarcus sp.]
MLNWLFSRPLQIKFFLGTALVVSLALLVLMLNVLQVMDRFLSHHIEQDMQQRTHILAMTLMVGPAAHKADDLRQLLQDVSDMHGYCYLSVQDSDSKLLATVGDAAANPEGCFDGAIPLIHDGKPFGMLHYGIDTGFVAALKLALRNELALLALLWLAVGGTVYYLLVRRLVKPLREITRASEAMAQGNLNAVMPKDLPQDELGQLAASFSNMAAALRERIESQQNHAHALYIEQARLNALVSILPVGILFADPAHRVQLINQECRRLWGLPGHEDFTGQTDTELITRAHGIIENPGEFAHQMANVVRDYGISPAFDTKLRNGNIIRSRSCVVPDIGGERYVGRIWLFEDATREYQRFQEIQTRAEHDALTGLFNRRRFEEDMERMFAHAQRNNGRLTLLYFDLDDFKGINDTYGHASGDKVLKTVAQTLMLQSRRNEIVYRLGGDEFAILVADAEKSQVERLAQRVTEAIAQLTFCFAERPMSPRSSMGIATCSPEERPHSAMELMQHADVAMYQAKHSGKNRWQVFDPARKP